MTLENLFAHGSQNRAFLVLTVCGMALAAFWQLTAPLRRKRGLGVLVDIFTGTGLLGMLLAVIWRYEGGVRAYAALGLIIGAVLYGAGLAQPIHAMESWISKLFHKREKTSPEEAGISGQDDEILSKTSGNG